MKILWSFWRSHREEKRPTLEEVACDTARNLIVKAVAGTLDDRGREILSEHLRCCTPCQLEMTQKRQEKERASQG